MPATASRPPSAATSRRRPRVKVAALGVIALISTAALHTGTSAAATTVELGTAKSFGVLGASTVTNTGPTTINGDLGVRSSAPTALVGFESSTPPGPGKVNGATHAGNQTADNAQADALTANGQLASQPCDSDLTGQDLGGLMLTPGVYCFSSSAGMTGDLTLNAQANPAAVFIIRVASALTTATASRVRFTNDFPSCNVFWQVGSSATLGKETDFVGTLIAHTSITAVTDASVVGRLIALNGAVTLDSNVITNSPCSTASGPTGNSDPVDAAPAGETPADAEPRDEQADQTPVGSSSSEGTRDGGSGGQPGGGGGGGSPVPATSTGGPSVPGRTGGPSGPNNPRPPLPDTGSNTTLGVVGVLAILIGVGLVRWSDETRTGPTRPWSSTRSAPRA